MPIFNITIDDASPFIQYAPSGSWSDSSHADAAYTSYLNETFHATNASDATATVTFNGSAVYLYGAFRSNHDVYRVTLDGDNTFRNGRSNGSDEFQQVMFSATGLSRDQHELVLKNNYTTPIPSYVDVDYVVITSGDGNSQTQSNDTVLDDGDPSIVYSEGWEDTPNQLITDYYNNTFHVTNQTGARATITFEGNAIAVYGATSDNHGPFTVVLDGGISTQLNGTAPTGVFRPQNLLYWAGGLSNSSHTLQIQNIDISTDHYLDLDKVVVSKWGNWGAGVTGNGTQYGSSTSSPITHHKSHAGAIAGGVVGGVIGLLCISLVLFFTYRSRRERLQKPGALLEENSPSNPAMKIEPFESFAIAPLTSSTTPNNLGSYSNVPRQTPLEVAVPAASSVQNLSSSSPTTPSSAPTSKQASSGVPPSSSPTVEPRSVNAQSGSASHNVSSLVGALNEDVAEDVPPPNYAEAIAHAAPRGRPEAG